MDFCNPSIDILKDKELYIFDMDGTIYLGTEVFDFAINFINNLRKSGKKVLFFTNNATRSDATYIEKLTRLGFSPTADEIMTSGDVTAVYLNNHRKNQSVYLVGTDDLYDDFCKKGINLVDGDAEKADIVVTSFDLDLNYYKLNNACRLIRGGAEFLSTHPDFNCPTEKGPIPDSGATTAYITAATGAVPRYFGKPYRETIDTISEYTGIPLEKMCIFGDRLYTDIALGKRYGVSAVLVLTGETTEDDVEAAADADKPDFVFDSLDVVNSEIFG